MTREHHKSLDGAPTEDPGIVVWRQLPFQLWRKDDVAAYCQPLSGLSSVLWPMWDGGTWNTAFVRQLGERFGSPSVSDSGYSGSGIAPVAGSTTRSAGEEQAMAPNILWSVGGLLQRVALQDKRSVDPGQANKVFGTTDRSDKLHTRNGESSDALELALYTSPFCHDGILPYRVDARSDVSSAYHPTIGLGPALGVQDFVGRVGANIAFSNSSLALSGSSGNHEFGHHKSSFTEVDGLTDIGSLPLGDPEFFHHRHVFDKAFVMCILNIAHQSAEGWADIPIKDNLLEMDSGPWSGTTEAQGFQRGAAWTGTDPQVDVPVAPGFWSRLFHRDSPQAGAGSNQVNPVINFSAPLFQTESVMVGSAAEWETEFEPRVREALLRILRTASTS